MARRGPTSPATVADIHAAATAMPHVTVYPGTESRPVYQVGGKSFVFFRTPRPDAVDPETGERFDDVVVIWVPSEADKQALVQDLSNPLFTTKHFDGHLSVLLRTSRVGEVSRQEVTELIQDAWLSRASRRRAQIWLAENGLTDDASG
ncbi:MmcQ/YjbR family DNA-binding protein [Jongsikchunia kroppenstedtii]|uniref:MmcQ/YjbR family DNA-binding protein n=1 Tax=Jongsikchunia kroppenstedtii TaxID=1121721 RepID=UPI000379936D|nr:MmcQ/YjbR family DNA-binding protein [Jongsikchunia kroppenstedtii]